MDPATPHGRIQKFLHGAISKRPKTQEAIARLEDVLAWLENCTDTHDRREGNSDIILLSVRNDVAKLSITRLIRVAKREIKRLRGSVPPVQDR